jgi:hypothetical protein
MVFAAVTGYGRCRRSVTAQYWSWQSGFVIPIDTVLASFERRYSKSFGTDAKQSEKDAFLSDIDQAFRCYAQPHLETAEKSLGRKLQPKVIFFDAFPGEKASLPVDWPPINNRALEVLIKEESEDA